MKCREVEPLIAEWVRGRLDPGAAPRVQDHLTRCDACRQAAAAETRLRSAVSALPAPELDRDLTGAVLARVSAPRKAGFWSSFRLPAYGFAGAAAAGACAVLMLSRVQPTAVTGPALASVDETRVVKLVADMRQMPDTSDDGSGSARTVASPWSTSDAGGGE